MLGNLVGQTLGRYRIIEKIGAGGMGVVYRARDERLDRDVAVKVLPASALGDENCRKRFRREALALSKLNHPNVATVYDFHSENGADYLVMEFVAGVTLIHKIQQSALSEKEIATLGAQIADALAEAHDHGIIHRDLKPGNIIVTPKGRVKVLDFGLARFLPLDDATTTSLAETQRIAGTLPYMSPEQVRGEMLDARTDIFSLGAVLYEMATGQRAFPETQSARLIDAIQRQAPPAPRVLNSQLSQGAERVILKCLEKDPDNRYQSAKEVPVDLRRFGAAEHSISSSVPMPKKSLRRLIWSAGVFIAAVLAIVAALWFKSSPAPWFAPAKPASIHSVAVLPLENLSRDPNQEYFAEGMTDELTTDLAQISALRVISRTSAMHYKGTREDLPQIARELNVDAVITGTVERAGDRVRIRAQLVDAAADKEIWARIYDRDSKDVLSMQSDVASAIAQQIQVAVTPQERLRLASARPVNPAAYQLYLQGRYFTARLNADSLKKAIDRFKQAIQIDPNYARAYSGLSEAYDESSIWGSLTPGEAVPKAREAVAKALQLDDTLSEAHASLAGIYVNYDWNWVAAGREYQRALQLDPGNANVQSEYAYFLMIMGRMDEALAEMQHARQLDPLSLPILSGVARVLYRMRHYDDAIAEYQKAIDLDPNFIPTYNRLREAYEQKKAYGQALAAWQKSLVLLGYSKLAAQIGTAYEASGYPGALRLWLVTAIGIPKSARSRSFEIAETYLVLGDKDQAFHWLEEAYREHDPGFMFLKTDPHFDSVRSDPRFKAILRRVGLAAS